MSTNATRMSVVLIVSVLALAMLSVAALPLLQQQLAKALNFNFGKGDFIHVNPKGKANLKIDGFHFVG
jgi:hypothetical protein